MCLSIDSVFATGGRAGACAVYTIAAAATESERQVHLVAYHAHGNKAQAQNCVTMKPLLVLGFKLGHCGRNGGVAFRGYCFAGASLLIAIKV